MTFREEYNKPDLVWLYDVVYSNDDDAKFYTQCAKAFGQPILELGSGTGRIAIPLAEEGFEVVGIDNSDAMIDGCMRKIEALKNDSLKIKIVNSDMAHFELERKFPLILISVNNFLLLDRDAQRSCLDCCKRHLEKSGVLIIDAYSPFAPSRAKFMKNQNDEKENLISMMRNPETGLQIRRYISCKRDVIEQVDYITNFFEIDTKSGIEERRYTEKLRYVYPAEMQLMLDYAGFKSVKIFGQYDGSKFDDKSELSIFMAQ